MGNGVEHSRREGDVPGPKKGGSLTSPTLTPETSRDLGEEEGNSQGINRMAGMTLLHSKPKKWNTPPDVRVAFWDFAASMTPEVEHGPGAVRHITVNGTFRALCSPWIHNVHPGPGASPQALHTPPSGSAGIQTESQVRPRSMQMRFGGMGAVARSSNAWRWSMASAKPP